MERSYGFENVLVNSLLSFGTKIVYGLEYIYLKFWTSTLKKSA